MDKFQRMAHNAFAQYYNSLNTTDERLCFVGMWNHGVDYYIYYDWCLTHKQFNAIRDTVIMLASLYKK